MQSGIGERALFLITGPPAAGKSTVARLLAEHLTPGVHLEGDFFRRCIVSGRHEMTPTQSNEAVNQLRLRYRLAMQSADTYFAAGFNVVVEDVFAGAVLAEVLGLIASRPLHMVVLLPSANAIAAREAARNEAAYSEWDIGTLHAGFADRTPQFGLWLDTTEQTPEATVEAILGSQTAALVET